MKKQIRVIATSLVLALSSAVVPMTANAAVSTAVSTDPTRGLAKANRPTVSFETWISSPTAIKVIKKESKGNCKAIGGKGKYRGKWQMNAGFWKSYGGLALAPTADQATCEQQDQIAYRGWLARGWSPWGIKS